MFQYEYEMYPKCMYSQKVALKTSIKYKQSNWLHSTIHTQRPQQMFYKSMAK